MTNILITGCSSGIGLVAARVLFQRGYNVVATVRNNDAKALEQLGIKVVLLDLDDSLSIQHAFDATMHHFDNHIDALFNNAAYGQPGAIEDLSRETLRQQFETNVFGTQELTNLVITQMRKQGKGRIIYNSSILGFIALAYRGAYNASKYALEGIADTLRLELHGSGINVSLIEPGPITSQFRANAYLKYQQNINKQHSPHRQAYEAMENRLTKPGPAAPFTLPPKAVVDKLIHALEAKRPKIRYRVTFPSTLFTILKRLLPQQALDWVLRKV